MRGALIFRSYVPWKYLGSHITVGPVIKDTTPNKGHTLRCLIFTFQPQIIIGQFLDKKDKMPGPNMSIIGRFHCRRTDKSLCISKTSPSLPSGRVRGLMNKPSKRERIEACTEACARMVTNMLRPVQTLSETLVCGRR